MFPRRCCVLTTTLWDSGSHSHSPTHSWPRRHNQAKVLRLHSGRPPSLQNPHGTATLEIQWPSRRKVLNQMGLASPFHVIVTLPREQAEERADMDSKSFLQEEEKFPWKLRDGCWQAGPSGCQLPNEAIKASVPPTSRCPALTCTIITKIKERNVALRYDFHIGMDFIIQAVQYAPLSFWLYVPFVCTIGPLSAVHSLHYKKLELYP